MIKKIYRIHFLITFLFSTFIYSQSTLVWTENKEEASRVSTAIKEGKSLLVFNTKLELTFESSIEKLDEIIKKDDLYYLQVSSGAQVITFKNNDNEYSINFGQLMDDNTLPSLKEKEIKYFTITEKKQLEYYNITENERSKGNVGVPIGPNVSDALIIVKLSPSDLNLEIKDVNNIISKIEKDKGAYKIFIKTESTQKNNVVLNLFDRDYGNTELPILDLISKEMRFYLVKKDKSAEGIDNKKFNEDNEALADYIKQLYLKNPFSDVTLIENNGNKFLVSVIELKSSNKAINTVAKTKAMLQINSYIDAVNTNRSYQINSDHIIESNTRLITNNIPLFLTSFQDPTGQKTISVYYSKISEKKTN